MKPRHHPQRGRSTSAQAGSVLFWAGMVLLGLLLWKMPNAPSHPSSSFDRSELQSQMETYVSNDQVPKIVRDLEESGVDVWIRGGQQPENNRVSFPMDGVLFLLLQVVFIIMMRRMRTSSTSLSAPGRPL